MDSRSAQEKAYSFLKERITNSTFRPNSRLKALEIAKELGISRTPVKEALGRLEQEGLVKRELGSGYVVQALSIREILNLYKVREVLEVEGAKELLQLLTEDIIHRLDEILNGAQALLQEKRYDDFLRATLKFHNAMVSATGNNVLCEILAGLNARIWSIGTIIVTKYPPRADEILFENRRILKALASRNVDDLERSIRAHIGGAGDSVKRLIEQEPYDLYIASA
ncbi:MAG: GntR family transcriptional regulator [Sulfuricaulis sp.]|uniref:GntR family transcriptional regulator n=1 Tax=Sulfuricaulis sp. TaxID=2003553 RepID=UPI0034A423D4